MWRGARWAAVLLALLVLTLYLVLWTPLRMVCFARIAQAVSASTGVQLAAQDLHVAPIRGFAEIDGLELRAPDAKPFLTLRKARAEIRWGSLFGDRTELSFVRVEGPRFDLGAPLPELPEGDRNGGSGGVDIRRFEVLDAELASGPLPAELEIWLDSLHVEGAEVRGSWVANALKLELAPTSVTVQSSRRPEVQVDVKGSFTTDADGGFEFRGLELSGADLDLTATGGGALDGSPIDLAYELAANPAGLFPDLTHDGQLASSGALTVVDDQLEGDLLIDAQRLPAELLVPMLGLSGVDGLDVNGTMLNLKADVETRIALDRSAEQRFDRLSGEITADWVAPDERRLELVVWSLDSADTTDINLAFDANILPDGRDTRRLVGSLQAASWLDLAAGTLGPTRVDVTIPDLVDAANRLGWALDLGGFEPTGELSLEGEVAGPLASLALHIDAGWRLDDEPLLTASVRSLSGVGVEQPLHLEIEAALLPSADGRRQVAGEVSASSLAALADNLEAGRLEALALNLQIPDLAQAMGDLRQLWPRVFPGHEFPAEWVEGEVPEGLLSGSLDLVAAGAGMLVAPRVEAEGDWQPLAGERLRFEVAAVPIAAAPYFAGMAGARVELTGFEIGRLGETLAGRISGSLDVAAAGADEWAGTSFAPVPEDRLTPPPTDSAESSTVESGGTPFPSFLGGLRLQYANLELEGSALNLGGTAFERLQLAAESDDTGLAITQLDGKLAAGQELVGRGRLEFGALDEALLHGGTFHLELPQPVSTLETLERVITEWTLEGGTVSAEITFQQSDKVPQTVALVRLPLGALRDRPELAGVVDQLPTAADDGEAWIGLSGLELEPFLPLLDLAEDAMIPHATLDGSITVNLSEPTASSGDLTISSLVIEAPQGRLEAAEPLQFVFGEQHLELRPSRLLASRNPKRELVASGRIDLMPGWQPSDSFESLVTEVDFDVDGTFDTSALNPMLAGGVAEGVATMRMRIHGPLTAIAAEGRYDGVGSALFFAAPYSTRLENPVFELSRRGANTVLKALRADLNGGTLEVSGDLVGPAGSTLHATFKDVRYRLDYGFNTRSSGQLNLRLPTAERRGRLAGDIVLDRGTLRRDMDIDRGLRSLLFAPDLTSTEGTSMSETLDLDLSIVTAQGVRIKNNLADLRADWNRIRVRGTLENPLISGEIEVDPGGKVTAYGQTVRIDEASIELAGDPIVSPRVVLKTTSSFDDPSVRGNRRGLSQSNLGDDGPGAGGFWESERAANDNDVSGEITGGLMSYYTDQFAGSLASGLERTELSLEPLPIFGETDTQARLTASYRVSPNVDLIYSVNPREAEGQTYLLDLHEFDIAPSLTAQIFTNDENNQGLTLVQILERGGGPELDETPRLRQLELTTPEGISRRRMKRALGLRKGDAFGADEAFDAELDVIEALRGQGYPGGEATVTVEPASRKRVDVGVEIETGPQVHFEFEGDSPSRQARRLIVQSYHPVDESSSLVEIEGETVKALRGEGFLHPKVTVVSEHDDPTRATSPRLVRIESQGGRRINPGPVMIEGVPSNEATALAAQFASRLMRVELAAGVPGADLFLVRSLRTLGYPDARIAARQLSEDGKRLTVQVEPGERNRIAKVEILGLPPADADRLARKFPQREGAPARSDDITRLAHAIEDALEERGYADAEVETELVPIAADRPHDLVLRCTIELGPLHRLGGLRVDGARATRDSWAEHIIGLEPGSTFRKKDIDEARRRLWRTGLFERVRTTTEPKVVMDGEASETHVVFNLDELPRYLIAYGGRWESGEKIGVVLDAIDQNLWGRGTTLGLRALYSDGDDRSLRLYHVTPRVRGTSGSLEIFLEGKSEITEGLLVNGLESWAQLTFPIGPKTTHRVYVRHQDLSIKDADLDEGVVLSTAEQRVEIPSLGWQLTYDTRDHALGRRRADGFSFGLDFTFTDDSIGSDISAFGLFSQLKYFRSLLRDRDPSKQLTWAHSMRVGFLEPFEDTPIPFVTRLRAGGEYSVRGYRTESLGPLDDAGNALGGEVLFVLNEELHFPIWGEQLGGLVFFDAGNIWRTTGSLDSELFTTFGVGFRASTPAGPLRLDIALPLDRRDGIDESVRFYLGFGNVF